MRVLGIETSCDETGLAIYETGVGLRSQTLHSQIELHAAYGGVVPELASRDHVTRWVSLLRQTVADAGLSLADLDGVAYTAGPGLGGALLVGAAAGRSLAWGLDIPALGVHHMEGHLLAPLMQQGAPEPPFVALLVSGGHTQLMRVVTIGRYELLGDTLDDAAGEAFDKTAQMLGLPYPGGPAIAQLAREGRPGSFRFTRPMIDRPGLDFSFSGLKTQALLAWRKSSRTAQDAADVALEFENAVVQTLVEKCIRALAQTKDHALVVAGGVGANLKLREQLQSRATRDGYRIAFPPPALCTDNGAMIAFAGALRLVAGQREDLAIRAHPRWDMASLHPVAHVAAS